MKVDVKRAWVTALRSGAYPQGTGLLKRGEGATATYCCLGVLAEVQGWPTRRTHEGGLTSGLADLNQKQLDAVGMTDDQQNKFIRMNDGGAVGVEGVGALEVDLSRTVKVQFDASIHNETEWRFVPDQVEMEVHPGQVLEAWYTATNLTGETLVAQAVPDVAPKRGLPYFNKTECFCFTEQLFEPGETRRMPVRFFMSPDLPGEVRTMTLSYAFYNNEHATRREQARLAEATGSIDATRG